MEMLIWEVYQSEINFFERKVNELFVETVIWETEIVRKKNHQELHVTKNDINHLVKLITMTLKAIAIVETFRYFQMEQIVLIDQNMHLFYEKRDYHFENLLTVFLLKIKTEEEEIDFTISR